MKHLIVLVLVLVSSLTACKATRIYNPDGIEKVELAYIFKKPHEAFSNKPSAFINAIFDNSGTLIMQFKPLQNAIKEAYLAPGKYKFVSQCNYGGGASDAEFIATVEAGVSYMYSCGINTEKVFIGSRILHKSYAIFTEAEI